MLNLSSLNNLSSLGKGSARPWYKSGSLLLNGVAPTLIHEYDNNRYAQYENVTNYLTYSQDLGDASWSKTRTTATTDVIAAPDGTLTADKLAEDSTLANTHALLKSITGAPAIGDYMTYSVYVKAAGRSRFTLKYPATVTTSGYEAKFDMLAGTVTSVVGGYSDTSFTYEGNGWWRASITGAAAFAAGTGNFIIYLDNGTSTTYDGDGTSGIYLWGQQFEYSNNPSVYVPTTTAAASLPPRLIPGTLESFDKFTRTSNATMIDSQGRLVFAPANLLRNSGMFNGNGWGTTRAAISYDSNFSKGDLYRLTEDSTATSTHVIAQTSLTAFLLNAPYTFSVYLKAGTRRYVGLLLPTGQFSGVTQPAYFDLELGVWGVTGGHTVTQEDVGDGVWRLSVTSTCTSAAAGAPVIYMATGTGGGANSYSGDGVSYLLAGAAQLELTGVDSPKPYFPSLGTEAYGPRFEYDPATLGAKGFVSEEARTNIITDNRTRVASWTSTFINLTEAGTILGVPALTATVNATGSPQFFYPMNASTQAASTLHTASVIVKRGNHPRVQLTTTNNAFQPLVADAYLNYNFDTDTLTVAGSSLPAPTGHRQLLGNDTVRLFLTFTSGTGPTLGAGAIVCFIDADGATRLGGTTTNGATVLASFPQLEAGGWGTSIIPTYNVAVTRAVESLTIPVDSWYADIGTFIVEFYPNYDRTQNRRLLLVAQATSYTDIVGVLCNTLGKTQGLSNTGGGANDFGSSTVEVVTNYELSKTAYTFNGADTKIVLDGGAIVADTTRTIPVANKGYKMWVDGYSATTNNTTGWWIKRIIFYPDASASDAQLQAKTS